MADTSTMEAHTNEQRSKDEFFGQLAMIGERMIAAHGRDFAIGTLVLLARFLVERNEPANSAKQPIGEWMKGAKPT
jgi:hypothetical protein